ncbi:MAG: ABC transporter permease [Bryobacteraceae bacterium]
MSAGRTLAMARKEMRHIARDARSLTLALAVPVMLLLLFGAALSLDVDRIPTLIHDGDRTPASREVVARFAGSRYFEVRNAGSVREVERSIDAGTTLLGVVIRNRQVQILIDGSDSNTASIAKGYAEAAVRGPVATRIEARPRVWYNSEIKSKNYVVPGLIAVIVAIIAALLTSLTIAREWESGTMEQLLSTPLQPEELVLGKMLAFFGIGVVDTAIAVVVGVFVFDVPFRGEVWLLGAMTCLFLSGALLWGILISAVARSQVLAFQLAMTSSFLPAFLLSGFVYAIEGMPPVIQILTYAFPARYFVTALKGIFLKGVGLEVLWAQAAFLAVYTTVVFAVATRKVGSRV